MKKTNVATLLVVLVLIPLTLILGGRLPGRGYYITSTFIVIEVMIPFFLAFEGRRPQARELVILAVMCALAVAARVAIPIPNFKAMFAVIMLSGIAFGAEAGFLVGAVSALSSNFFYSQGPYTPWQMMAFGAAGLIAGFAYQKKFFSRKPLHLAVFGFLGVLFIVGPVLDTGSVFLVAPRLSLRTVLPFYVSGFAINLSQACCTFVTMLIFGNPLLDKLDRIKQKYGMMEDGNGGVNPSRS